MARINSDQWEWDENDVKVVNTSDFDLDTINAGFAECVNWSANLSLNSHEFDDVLSALTPKQQSKMYWSSGNYWFSERFQLVGKVICVTERECNHTVDMSVNISSNGDTIEDLTDYSTRAKIMRWLWKWRIFRWAYEWHVSEEKEA